MFVYSTIKKLARDDRPREKMLEKGAIALSDAEILAILIGSGTRDKSAVDLCREILKSVGNDLSRLARLTIHDLMKFKGVGEAKAVSIAAALELSRRKKTEAESVSSFVKSSKDAFNAILPLYEDLNHEEFHVIGLSRSNKIIGIDLVSKGGFNSTIADGKVIFKKALEKGASGIILAHNHPSGNLRPSDSDIDLTKKMKSFGCFIELPVLDHIIVADRNYFSFADNGMI
ncbi:MAG: DNA repair protein RadC [Bacteroidetes bacterium]|nr:DNA repair protein RadC [Bacteroidota bacterium]